MQSEVRENVLHVQGEVSVRTLDKTAYAQFERLCRQPEIQAVDFGGVLQADSTCIALLLTVLRNTSAGSLKIQSLPESVQMLAELYEVETWFD